MIREPLQHIDIICYITLSQREDREKIMYELNSLGIAKEKVIHIEAVNISHAKI